MRDTGAHQSGVDMLTVSVEQGQLAAGLSKAAKQVAPLRRVGTACLGFASFDWLARIGLRVLNPFQLGHFPPFSLLQDIELLLNAVEREIFRYLGAAFRPRSIPQFRWGRALPRAHRVRPW